jgi:hypothetical protein
VVGERDALGRFGAALQRGRQHTQLLSLPRLGVLQADCANGNASVELVNKSGPTGHHAHDRQLPGGRQLWRRPTVQWDAGHHEHHWMASFGLGSGLHLATINTKTRSGLPPKASDCPVSAQATYTS